MTLFGVYLLCATLTSQNTSFASKMTRFPFPHSVCFLILVMSKTEICLFSKVLPVSLVVSYFFSCIKVFSFSGSIAYSIPMLFFSTHEAHSIHGISVYWIPNSPISQYIPDDYYILQSTVGERDLCPWGLGGRTSIAYVSHWPARHCPSPVTFINVTDVSSKTKQIVVFFSLPCHICVVLPALPNI